MEEKQQELVLIHDVILGSRYELVDVETEQIEEDEDNQVTESN